MSEFLMQNGASILILAAIALAVGFLCYRLVRDRREGRSSCGGCNGCSGCSMQGKCHSGEPRR